MSVDTRDLGGRCRILPALITITAFCVHLLGQEHVPRRRPGLADLHATRELSPLGDVDEKLVYYLTIRDWGNLRKRITDETIFKRELGSHRADWEPGSEPVCELNAGRHSLEMSIKECGPVRNLGNGRWQYTMSPSDKYMIRSRREDGRLLAVFTTSGSVWALGNYEGRIEVVLPEEAKGVQWDAMFYTLSYTLPEVAEAGPVNLQTRFLARRRIMSTTYKVYSLGATKGAFSDQWVARTVFKNTGKGVIKNLKVNYKLEGYDSIGLQDSYSEVIPGQTVVSLYYPVLKPDIAKLRSAKTSVITMEWTYEDANGKRYEGQKRERPTVLGLNEFVFSDILGNEKYGTWADTYSNAQMLAAWVSENDPIISEFAASAIAFARGTAPSSDMATLEWMYNTMLVADIVYGLPAGRKDRHGESFDVTELQNVRLPRDVLREKKGTCIDLAILYAAMCHANGLRCYLMIRPGHCFPVVQLRGPEGKRVAVETTYVGGGWKANHKSWQEAYHQGQKELEQWINSPHARLLDVSTLWAEGVHGPELERMEGDIMHRWKLDRDSLERKLHDLDSQRTGLPPRRESASPSVPVPVPVPTPAPAPATLRSNLEGSWTGAGYEGNKKFPITVEVTRNHGLFRVVLLAVLGNAQVEEVYSASREVAGALTSGLQSRRVTDRATREQRSQRGAKATMIVALEGQDRLRVTRTRMDRPEKSQEFVLSRR